MDPYRPVACAFHERLEYAVLKRVRLRLRWDEKRAVGAESVLPADVFTGDGAEWLRFRDAGGEARTVRLDCILSAEDLG
jgi:Rho-binding antiterminator